jgi:hypothetical protein
MAKNIIFRDCDGVEMEVHLNVIGNGVLVLDYDDNCIVYAFEDKEEIEDLICELNRLKDII